MVTGAAGMATARRMVVGNWKMNGERGGECAFARCLDPRRTVRGIGRRVPAVPVSR